MVFYFFGYETIVFGLFLLMLSGTTGCLTATFLFGGIIAMAYLS